MQLNSLSKDGGQKTVPQIMWLVQIMGFTNGAGATGGSQVPTICPSEGANDRIQ